MSRLFGLTAVLVCDHHHSSLAGGVAPPLGRHQVEGCAPDEVLAVRPALRQLAVCWVRAPPGRAAPHRPAPRLDLVHPPQTFSQGRLKTLDLVVVVMNLLLQITHPNPQALVGVPDEIEILAALGVRDLAG